MRDIVFSYIKGLRKKGASSRIPKADKFEIVLGRDARRSGAGWVMGVFRGKL